MAFDKNNPKNHKRRKVCQFCVDKATFIDYKDTAKLRHYLSERGKILPRRTTVFCLTFSTDRTTKQGCRNSAAALLFFIPYLSPASARRGRSPRR